MHYLELSYYWRGKHRRAFFSANKCLEVHQEENYSAVECIYNKTRVSCENVGLRVGGTPGPQELNYCREKSCRPGHCSSLGLTPF